MENKTQHDIVTQYLQSLQAGEVVTEKLTIPGLENLFVVQGNDAGDVTEGRLRLPIAHKVSVTTRAEIVSAMIQCIQSSPNIVGVNWKVGDEFIAVYNNKQATVGLSEGITEEDIHQVLMNIIRSRAALQGFDWKFDQEFVSISHENRQYV